MSQKILKPENKLKSGKNIVVARNATSGLLDPLQRAADARGHGPQTAGSGWGGLVGAIIGSFGGPLGAAMGAAVGAGLGYVIAEENAGGPRDQ